MQIIWNAGNNSSPDQFYSSFATEMVTGGSHQITIRLKTTQKFISGNMEVYIDGCLKSGGAIDYIEYQRNSIPANERPPPMPFINGVLSDIKYFAIGDSCSSRLVLEQSTDLYDSSDIEICGCSDGFTGATCQEEWTQEEWTKHETCQNVDCAADFDRCANFDRTECSECDLSFQQGRGSTVRSYIRT